MKNKIKYNNKEMLYDIKTEGCGEYDAFKCYKTHFYDTEPIIIKERKYKIFGKYIEKKKYKHLFSLRYNIESPTYTKEKIRKDIHAKIKLLERSKEIERGEII